MVITVHNLGLLLNTGFSAYDNAAHAAKKNCGMLFLPKAILRYPGPLNFPPSCTKRLFAHVLTSNTSILPQSLTGLVRVVKFVKGLRHAPHEANPQRLRLFSLARRRVNGDQNYARPSQLSM